MRLCESRPWSRLRLDLVLGSKWLQVSIKNGITAILMYEGLHIKYANITLDHITKCHEENFQVCVCGGGGGKASGIAVRGSISPFGMLFVVEESDN